MVRFLGVSPRLPVLDLNRAARFYVDVLGFEAGDPWPEDNPTFVLVQRGHVILQFVQAGVGEPVGNVTISINVDDALAIYEAVKDRVAIEWGPEVYWYGRREFSFVIRKAIRSSSRPRPATRSSARTRARDGRAGALASVAARFGGSTTCVTISACWFRIYVRSGSSRAVAAGSPSGSTPSLFL